MLYSCTDQGVHKSPWISDLKKLGEQNANQIRAFPFFLLGLLFAALVLPTCDALNSGKPAVIIAAPPSGSTYREGDDVAVQSTSADKKGVVRIEMTVDGAVVHNDTPPAPQLNFSLIQTWKATPGSHTIIVRAYNAAGASSDPAAITIQVSPSIALGTSSSASSLATSSASSGITPSASASSAPPPSSSSVTSTGPQPPAPTMPRSSLT